MSQLQENSFSNVISINPYNNIYLSGISKKLTPTTTPEYSKSQFCISYLNTKGFITSRIEISKNIADEDLYDAITNKVYDELALDQAVSYKIQYIETFNNVDEENRFFNVFIINPQDLDSLYTEALNKIKYVDMVIPAPLLLKSLYTKEIIKGEGTHCFIYFQENDAFVTIYHNQEFIYTKAIHYTLVEMHERFCELYGEKIEYEAFIKFISQENLKDSQSEYKQHLITLYKEMLTNVNEIITYVKRAYELEKIDLVYIGIGIESLTKFNEIAETELGIKSVEFEFDYGYLSDANYIDQIHSLMQVYTTVDEDYRYDCNFTLYPRPPKFTKRVSGQLIILTVASIIISFIYPASYWALTYANSLKHELLKNDYTKIHNEKIDRELNIRAKEADKKKVITLLKNEEGEYISKKETLIKIHDVKVNYPMKAKIVAALIKDFNKYNVYINALLYTQEDNPHFVFSLVTLSDKEITILIEHLTKQYDGKFSFLIETIKYDENIKRYLCELKVRVL